MALTSEQTLIATSRSDNWWLAPLSVAVGLGLFGVYSFWAAFQGNYYQWPLSTLPGHHPTYLSPFYSPLFIFDWWKFSPAFLILWAPLGFRATCYYYRKAYYRAYFLTPPACGVKIFKDSKYKGETSFPFIIQNIHRYFMYIAVGFIFILWTDVVRAFNFNGEFGMGVGTLVLLVNTSLLSLYTFSCHSLRHMIGGRLKCFSACRATGELQHKAWEGVSCLNTYHMLWAWCSLCAVGFADLYVRLVSMGIIHDWRIF